MVATFHGPYKAIVTKKEEVTLNLILNIIPTIENPEDITFWIIWYL